jgi:hypothetical protein
MSAGKIYILLCTVAFLAATGCERAQQVDLDEEPQEAVDESASISAENSESVTALKSELADLEHRLDEAEEAAKGAQHRADEAHDLAEEAGSVAEKACKPYGYQYGCGNSGE